jgi:hypothetical protein
LFCELLCAFTGDQWSADELLAVAVADLTVDCPPSDDDADYFSVYSQESDSELWAIKQQAAALTISPETFPFKKKVGQAVREAAAAVASDGPSGATSSRRAYAAVAAARKQEAAAAAAGASAQQEGGEPAATEHKVLLQTNFPQLIQHLELSSTRLGELFLTEGERQDMLEQVIGLRYAAQSLSIESDGEADALLWYIEQCTALLEVSLA